MRIINFSSELTNQVSKNARELQWAYRDRAYHVPEK